MSNVDESIIKKVQALLALAARGGSPEESANAAAKAQALMDKHKLDRLTVETPLEDETVYDSRKGPAFFEAEGKVIASWVHVVASAVTQVNDLFLFGTRRRKDDTRLGVFPGTVKETGTLEVFGRKEDIQTAKYVFDFLVAEIERLAKLHKGQGRTWLNNFKLAAAETVGARLKAAKLETQAAYQASELGERALVRLQDRMVRVERAAKSTLGTLKTVQRTCRGNNDARAAGAAAGASIRLGGAGGALSAGQRRIGAGKK